VTRRITGTPGLKTTPASPPTCRMVSVCLRTCPLDADAWPSVRAFTASSLRRKRRRRRRRSRRRRPYAVVVGHRADPCTRRTARSAWHFGCDNERPAARGYQATRRSATGFRGDCRLTGVRVITTRREKRFTAAGPDRGTVARRTHCRRRRRRIRRRSCSERTAITISRTFPEDGKIG